VQRYNFLLNIKHSLLHFFLLDQEIYFSFPASISKIFWNLEVSQPPQLLLNHPNFFSNSFSTTPTPPYSNEGLQHLLQTSSPFKETRLNTKNRRNRRFFSDLVSRDTRWVFYCCRLGEAKAVRSKVQVQIP